MRLVTGNIIGLVTIAFGAAAAAWAHRVGDIVLQSAFLPLVGMCVVSGAAVGGVRLLVKRHHRNLAEVEFNAYADYPLEFQLPWLARCCACSVEMHMAEVQACWIEGRIDQGRIILTASRHGELEEVQLVLSLADPLGLFSARVTTLTVMLIKVNPRHINLPPSLRPLVNERGPQKLSASSSRAEGDLIDFKCSDQPVGRILWRAWISRREIIVRQPDIESEPTCRHFHFHSTDANAEQPAAELARFLVERGEVTLSVPGARAETSVSRALGLIRRSVTTCVDLDTPPPAGAIVVTGLTTALNGLARFCSTNRISLVIALRDQGEVNQVRLHLNGDAARASCVIIPHP
jgi:hypothetical protein